MLKLELPFRVGTEGVAELRLALGLEREHFAGVIEDRGGRVLFRAAPFRVGQRTERRRFFPDPDVARNHEGLLERHVKFGLVRELEHQHFARIVLADFLQAVEAPDALLEMHDEVAFVQIAEIDLRAMGAEFRRPLQAASAVRRGAPEKFGGGEDDELGGGETEAAPERAFEQFDSA